MVDHFCSGWAFSETTTLVLGSPTFPIQIKLNLGLFMSSSAFLGLPKVLKSPSILVLDINGGLCSTSLAFFNNFSLERRKNATYALFFSIGKARVNDGERKNKG